MTRRQQYWQDLFAIRAITGQLNRRMSFVEAANWLIDYQAETTTGYPKEHAIQRAYDFLFAPRVRRFSV